MKKNGCWHKKDGVKKTNGVVALGGFGVKGTVYFFYVEQSTSPQPNPSYPAHHLMQYHEVEVVNFQTNKKQLTFAKNVEKYPRKKGHFFMVVEGDKKMRHLCKQIYDP